MQKNTILQLCLVVDSDPAGEMHAASCNPQALTREAQSEVELRLVSDEFSCRDSLDTTQQHTAL